MQQFSTAELVKHIGDVTHAASQAPVTITQHRKPRYVLLTAELFEAMRREADPRRAFGPGELPEDEADAVTKALRRSIAELEAREGGGAL